MLEGNSRWKQLLTYSFSEVSTYYVLLMIFSSFSTARLGLPIAARLGDGNFSTFITEAARYKQNQEAFDEPLKVEA
jgi:hypothetical protein